jgi:hypothetical protein
VAAHIHRVSLFVALLYFLLLFLYFVIANILFCFLNKNGTVLKIGLCFFYLFEILKNTILPQLIPIKINIRIIGIGFLNIPPGSVSPKNVFYQRGVVSFADE